MFFCCVGFTFVQLLKMKSTVVTVESGRFVFDLREDLLRGRYLESVQLN